MFSLSNLRLKIAAVNFVQIFTVSKEGNKNQLKNILLPYSLDCSSDRRKEGDLGHCSDPVIFPSPLVASLALEGAGKPDLR